jgi:hypothetical protein
MDSTCDDVAMSKGPPQQGALDPDTRLRAANVAVAGFLQERADGLADKLLELLRAQLPVYADETLGALRDRVRVVLDLAITRLRQGDVPDSRDAEALAILARGWAAEGLPLDQRSFQVGARHVVAVVASHAAELELDAATMFELQNRVWEWATMCASILADAHRDHAVALARRDAAARAEFLRDLAAGRVTPERLAQASDTYALNIDELYFAVCARCEDPAVGSALEAHVRRSGSTDDRRTLQVVVDGRLLAVAPQAPTPYGDVTIAVGAATSLEDAHASFSEALEALATARAFGITGVVDLASLGPLPLITEAQTFALRLTHRHMRELDARGASGAAIEQTIRTLLDHDRNVEAAAAELHVHRNSIRYRVGRFHELTGLDLRKTEDLVTTWWLLKRRQASHAAD